MPEPYGQTTSSSCSPRAGRRRKARIAGPQRPSGTFLRPSANGSSAGCEGSRSQVFLDSRNVLLDRDFRLLRLGRRREAHHEERLAAAWTMRYLFDFEWITTDSSESRASEVTVSAEPTRTANIEPKVSTWTPRGKLPAR